MPLLISAGVDGSIASLRAVGDIDVGTEPDFWSAMEKAVTGNGVGRVVIDLAEIGFMDCFGMSALIRGRQLADQRGRGFQVVNATGIPLIVLQTTGVLDYLNR